MKSNTEKKGVFRYLAAGGIVLFCMSAFLVYKIQEKDLPSSQKIEKHQTEEKLETAMFEDGDVIVRRGTGVWANLSLMYSTKYSHIGLIRKSQEGFFVIHADGNPEKRDSVKKQPLQEFIKESKYWGLYRFDFDEKIRTAIAEQAESFAEQQIPFDDDFSLETEDKLYCSEMVWLAVKKVTEKDIVPKKSNDLGTTYVGIDDIFLGSFAKKIK